MPKVLIVDDEESVSSMLEEFLGMNGYCCSVAASAAEARSLIRHKQFDLILSDLNMPGESGFQLLRYVLSERPGTSAILYTGYHTAEVKNKALELGVTAYITKPFSLGGLLSCVKGALAHR